MKKLVLLLAALVAVTCSVSAQKLTKEEKKAQKEAQAAQTAALMQKMFAQHSFKFIPESYTLGNGERNNIDGYQEVAIRPDSFRCEITGLGLVDVNRYELLKETTEKTGYTLSIKIEANGEILNFNFIVNSKSGLGTLRIKSNKSSDRVYNGTYREF